jgi:hypothetical protein
MLSNHTDDWVSEREGLMTVFLGLIMVTAGSAVRSTGTPPAGVLTDGAVGQSIGLLLPENAILVTDSATREAALYHRIEGARAHDYLFADEASTE